MAPTVGGPLDMLMQLGHPRPQCTAVHSSEGGCEHLVLFQGPEQQLEQLACGGVGRSNLKVV